jgi:predicted amidohydrolase
MQAMPGRIALAQFRYPSSPAESVQLAVSAVAEAAAAGAQVICFPECFVPGYRWPGRVVAPPDRSFLEHAWDSVAAAAQCAKITVILGTERFVGDELRLTALVLNADGTRAGFQDKVQLDPSEEPLYAPGTERRIFAAGPLKFGIVICHEGWRYPETVRWAARQGAQVVFHPHYAQAEPGGIVPAQFRDPANTFHESAILCRAAENTCYFASVNCAAKDAPITSAIAAPDGTLVAAQPYGQEGLLLADLNLIRATGLLAHRLRRADGVGRA